MDSDPQKILQVIQEQCQIAQNQHHLIRNSFQAGSDQLSNQINQSQNIQRTNLKAIKDLKAEMQARGKALAQIRSYNHENLKKVKQERIKNRVVERKSRQTDMNQLSMQIKSLLNFVNLQEKRAKMEKELLSERNLVKQEIRKVKLSITLTEMELKDLQEMGKKSRKFA